MYQVLLSFSQALSTFSKVCYLMQPLQTMQK